MYRSYCRPPVLFVLPLTLTWRQSGWEGRRSGVGGWGSGVRHTCALYMHWSYCKFPVLFVLPLTLTWRQSRWEGQRSGVRVGGRGRGSDIPVCCTCTGVSVGSPSCSSSLWHGDSWVGGSEVRGRGSDIPVCCTCTGDILGSPSCSSSPSYWHGDSWVAGSEVRGQRSRRSGVRPTCALYMSWSLYCKFPILFILLLTLTWRQSGWQGRGSGRPGVGGS